MGDAGNQVKKKHEKKSDVLLPIIFARQAEFTLLVVIVSLLSAVWDMQYVILQRYNRPKVVRLMKDLQTPPKA